MGEKIKEKKKILYSKKRKQYPVRNRKVISIVREEEYVVEKLV
jgi:hypothetical protein